MLINLNVNYTETWLDLVECWQLTCLLHEVGLDNLQMFVEVFNQHFYDCVNSLLFFKILKNVLEESLFCKFCKCILY